MKTIQLSERELSMIFSMLTPPYAVSGTHTGEFNELRNKVFYALRDAQNDEPVSNRDELPKLIEGMAVSVDVSTCDHDHHHRYFGTVTEVSELNEAKNGYILLVQDAKPNFNVNGNSPVIPDGWIKCSERLPEDGQTVLCHNTMTLLSGIPFIADYLEEFQDRLGNKMADTGFYVGRELNGVTHWMPLPAAPQGVK